MTINKNTAKKYWRQIDEASGAIEQLIHEGVLSENHWNTFEDLVVLKNDLEEITEIEPLKGR